MSAAREHTPLRMLAIVNSLHVGGAEMNLVRSARALGQHGIEVTILPLKAGGALRDLALQHGIEVLGSGFPALLRAWWERWPLVEGWMYGGALIASTFGIRGARVVWNLRHVPEDPALESRTTRAILALLRWLPKPKVIHVNARAAIEAHRRLGLRGNYVHVPNGVDTDEFRFDPAAAEHFRRTANIQADARLVVQVARRHVQKGQTVLLQATGMLLKRGRSVVIAFIGEGTQSLAEDARQLGIPAHACRFLGMHGDPIGAYCAADVVVNPSLTEASPTVLAEAMSCSAVCVATDVGETRDLLGVAGIVVSPGNAESLANAIDEVLGMSPESRQRRRREARSRIESEFALSATATRYAESLIHIHRAN